MRKLVTLAILVVLVMSALPFTIANAEDAGNKADQIIALETRMAEVMWPREKRRNRDLTLNQIDRSELNELYPNFNWDALIAQRGYKANDLNISQPDPTKGLKC